MTAAQTTSATLSRPGRLRRLAALAALAVGLPAMAACGGQAPTTSSPAPTASTSSDASTSPDSGTQASEDPTWIAEGGGAAWWVMPDSAEGWEVTVWETDGVNQLKRGDGCQITSQQNLLDSTATDREESEAWVEQAVAAYERQGMTNIVQTSRDDTTSIHAEGSAQTVELVRMDISYTGADGVDYQGVRWFRAFTQMEIPTILQLSYFCPTDTYDSAALDTLLEDIAIGDAQPLDMDS